MLIPRKQFSYPLRRPFYFSFIGHGVFLFAIMLLSWLGPKLPPRREFVSLPPTIQISAPDPTPAPTATPKPTPRQTPQPTAKPTPRPTLKPTPAPTVRPTPQRTIAVSTVTPTPTVKPTPETPDRILADNKKEIVATPTPTPRPTPERTAAPTPAPTVTPRPEIKDTPPPVQTPRAVPAPTAAASRTPSPTPGPDTRSAAFQVTDDVRLSQDYMQDAVRRLQEHFRPPGHLSSRAKSCVLSFRIRNDGSIYDIAVENSTGFPGLDRLAEQALVQTGRLLPLTPYTDRPDIKATVRFTFDTSGR